MAKPPKKTPKPVKPNKSPVAALTQRVTKLETHIKGLSLTAPAAASASTTGPNIVTTGAAPDSRRLTFLLAPGGPAVVKLTLDSTEVIILGTGTSSSKPRAKGSVTSLLIDLHGNSGQQASITIGNAIPATVTATIPPGRSDWSESRALLAKW